MSLENPSAPPIPSHLESPVQIGTMRLETPLVAAATSATADFSDLTKLTRTAIGAITLKSATLAKRAGNEECNYFSDKTLVVNAKGLPGPDIAGTNDLLAKLHQSRSAHNSEGFPEKPLILSVAGMQPHEYAELIAKTRLGLGRIFSAYELNFSCPNVPGKPIIGYDLNTSERIIDDIFTRCPDVQLGVKLPPFYSKSELENLTESMQEYLNKEFPGWKVTFDQAEFFDRDKLILASRRLNLIAKRHPGLQFVTATNTLANCRITHPNGETLINSRSNNGRGGLSGDFLHPIAVENVRTLAENLDSNIAVIGTGGVKDRKTAEDFLHVGAKAVGIGGALMDSGPRIIHEILLS